MVPSGPCQDLECPLHRGSSRAAPASAKGKKLFSSSSLASQSGRREGGEGEIEQGTTRAKSAGSIRWKDDGIVRNKYHSVQGNALNPHRSGKHSNDHSRQGRGSPLGCDSTIAQWEGTRCFDSRGDGIGHTEGVTPDVGRVGQSLSSSNSHEIWGRSRTVCKTRQAAEIVDLPRVGSAGGGLKTVGLRYRVGARWRQEGKARFR